MYKLENALNLKLFGEGDGSNGGNESATAETGEVADPQGVEEQPATVDLDAEFEELIKTKYKEQYGKRVHDTVSKRLKSAKADTEKLSKLSPVIDTLARHHKLNADDIDGIVKAVDADDYYYENESAESGKSISELRMQRQNDELRAKLDDNAKKEQIMSNLSKWNDEAMELKKSFPGFELSEELSDDKFTGYLENGMSVEDAFYAKYHKDIMSGAIKNVAEEAAVKLSNSVAAGKKRPAENGNGSNSAGTITKDVSKLTKEERAKLAERALHGERITFG